MLITYELFLFLDEVQVHTKLGEIVANLNATRNKRLELENERDTSPTPFGAEVN